MVGGCSAEPVGGLVWSGVFAFQSHPVPSSHFAPYRDSSLCRRAAWIAVHGVASAGRSSLAVTGGPSCAADDRGSSSPVPAAPSVLPPPRPAPPRRLLSCGSYTRIRSIRLRLRHGDPARAASGCRLVAVEQTGLAKGGRLVPDAPVAVPYIREPPRCRHAAETAGSGTSSAAGRGPQMAYVIRTPETPRRRPGSCGLQPSTPQPPS